MGNLGSLLEELFGTESWGQYVLQLRIDGDYLIDFDSAFLRATAPEVGRGMLQGAGSRDGGCRHAALACTFVRCRLRLLVSGTAAASDCHFCPTVMQGEDGVAVSATEAEGLLSPALGNTSLPARTLLVERWNAGARGDNGTQIGAVQVRQ